MNDIKEINEYFKNQLDSTNMWLSFAEAKNAALLAFNIALLALYYNLYSINKLFTIALMIISIISSVISLMSFRPNLNNLEEKKGYISNNINLLFYGDIANINNSNEYISLVHKIYFPNNQIEDLSSNINSDYAKEIIMNSKIAQRKYKLFKQALMLDIINLSLCIIFLLLCA